MRCLPYPTDHVYNLSFSGMLTKWGCMQVLILLSYIAFYDVFYRIIQISTIKIGDIDVNELTSLKLNE